MITAALGCLVGFTGHERYIELDAFVNARSSARFRQGDQNIKAVLGTGTRGEILESQKLPSGNYALKVQTINGSHKGKSFWVYYNVGRPAMKTYATAPPEWGIGPTENAVAETTRDIPAYKAEAVVTPAAVVEQADALNQILQGAAGAKGTDGCAGCAGLTPAGEDVPIPTPAPRSERAPVVVEEEPAVARPETVQSRIKDPTKDMKPACYKFIRQDGTYGEWGQQVAAIMKEKRYQSEFTSSNALGAFCPKFNSLGSVEKKLQAWTWFWQSLAMEESQCNRDILHPTRVYSKKKKRWIVINPRPGWGLWAMEKDANIRADRGPECKNIRTAEGQARCAIFIMYNTQLTKGDNASESTLKYWGPTLNARYERQIMPHMKRFAACF